MSYAGFYINLDRSTERRAQIEGELQRFNLGALYTRFKAIDGNDLKPSSGLMPGTLGCWMSHYQLLKENLDRDRHLHIVEDDAIFSTFTEPVIRWLITERHLEKCDIIYTDVSVPLRNDIYKSYKALFDKAVDYDEAARMKDARFQIVDLSKTTWSSTTSFVVNKNSIRKIHDLFEQEIARGPSTPIDLFMREKNYEGSLKVGCVFPFVTSLRLADSFASIIDPRDNRFSEVAAAIGRYAFFIGCDRELCRQWLDKFVPVPEDWLTTLLGRLLTHSITENYRFF